MLAGIFARLSNALVIAMVIGLAIPGLHRVVLPSAFGMSEIAPQVWTDAPGRAVELRGLVEQSRAGVAAFFGDISHPTIILCSSRTCADRFGIGGNGLSIGHWGVMVSPGGLTRGTLTHELTHSRLHRSMGPRNLIRQPYPTWFDEGLATHVARHPRWRGQITPADRARVRQVQQFWDWAKTYRTLGVGRAYAAAGAEVAAIQQRIGRAGLLELINRAEAGEDFDTVLAELTSQ